jgi:hypothetical protein
MRIRSCILLPVLPPTSLSRFRPPILNIYRMLREEIRSGAFFPGAFASVLTLQGKCLLFRAKATHSSEHLLANSHTSVQNLTTLELIYQKNEQNMRLAVHANLRKMAWEWVRASHKPNSVPMCAARPTGGNHLSGTLVTQRLKQPTRGLTDEQSASVSPLAHAIPSA